MSKQDRALDAMVELVADVMEDHGEPGPHHHPACPDFQPHHGPRINVTSRAYRDGYDRIFGRKPEDRAAN